MKHYKSLEEKAEHILNNVICNLEPAFKRKLKSILMVEDLKINELIKKAKDSLCATEKRSTGRYYWLARGWSKSIAQAKIVEARKHKKEKLSPYSVEFWLQKINPSTGVNYTKEEADYKRNSLRPIRKEYWLDKGYSKAEAEAFAKSTKTNNNKAGASTVKNRESEEIRSSSPRCIEYWMARGSSLEEARELVSKTQSTFSLEILQEKYGDAGGEELWRARQENGKPR